MKNNVRHRLFLQVIAELHKWNIESVAKQSNVHVQTLYSWLQGRVVSPHVNTLLPVAEAVGFCIDWKKAQKSSRKAA